MFNLHTFLVLIILFESQFRSTTRCSRRSNSIKSLVVIKRQNEKVKERWRQISFQSKPIVEEITQKLTQSIRRKSHKSSSCNLVDAFSGFCLTIREMWDLWDCRTVRSINKVFFPQHFMAETCEISIPDKG
ncbi:CLUMA_CG012515, isoform A [Clunio marinus]|uniref:CLUMA_CG012515, isoform A n=1 Tax=Clunio marinus TaxID=568069 RepID=A0A1J1IFX4_9DIPT|nr:CLUMA_CG012515, isoform A [Clunio marinus]